MQNILSNFNNAQVVSIQWRYQASMVVPIRLVIAAPFNTCIVAEMFSTTQYFFNFSHAKTLCENNTFT